MDFDHTKEQELLRSTVRQFAKDVLSPDYQRRDKVNEPSRELRLKMGELGLLGLGVAEKYGGTDTDGVTMGIVLEELARGDLNVATLVMSTNATGGLISKLATEKIKEQYLPRLMRGEILVCFAITEPHCGSDAAAMSTLAVRDGDSYVLTGEKSSISFAPEADAAVVWAKTDPSAGSSGITAFLVPMDTPGVATSLFNDLGQRFLIRGAIHLDRVRVPVENVVGEVGGGLHRLMNLFPWSRSLIGLMCVGMAQQTMEETIEYVKTREAFGKPISRNEGVAFPIVDIATRLEAARWLCYRGLWLRDQDRPHMKEASMAKAWVPRLAVESIHQMLLLYGHAGYSDDYPIAQRLRDVIGLEFGDGTAEIMKLIISRELFGRDLSPS